jgi:hypothetical protein
VFVFEFVGVIGDHDLKEKCSQQAEVGNDADVGVIFDYELLAEKKRENHRNDHCGSVVECMKQGGGKQDSFFHRELEVGYIANR